MQGVGLLMSAGTYARLNQRQPGLAQWYNLQAVLRAIPVVFVPRAAALQKLQKGTALLTQGVLRPCQYKKRPSADDAECKQGQLCFFNKHQCLNNL